MDTKSIQKIVEDFIGRTTFSVDDISVSYDEENNQFWCRVSTSEPQVFIGRSGENLMAINHIVRKIIEKESRGESPQPARPALSRLDGQDKLGEAGEAGQSKIGVNVIVDVNDYQKKRIENLKTMAHMMAERARFFKSSVEVDPMSSYDRRIIHEFLTDAPDIETESTGEGRDRRVVIKYIPKS